MRFQKFSFGSICIDGTTYEHDVVIDRGEIRKREKKPSKKFRETFGHTPLSVKEKIPWECRRLVIGAGAGALPVMDEVKKEAKLGLRENRAMIGQSEARMTALYTADDLQRRRTVLDQIAARLLHRYSCSNTTFSVVA